MNLKDRIWAWFLFAQDTILVVLVFLAVCLPFVAINLAEYKEPSIDYEPYPGRTAVLEASYRDLYTVAGKPPEMLLNGREVKYTYQVDGIEYVNVLFFRSYNHNDIIRLIHEGRERDLQVCYRLDKPGKSVLKVKDGLLVP